MKRLNKVTEGELHEVSGEDTQIEVIEVSNELPKQLNKVDKKDTNFEDFIQLYTPLINDKFTEEYGDIEDKDLWNDLAKEMYLKSKYYVLQGDEYKPEKIEESKSLTEDVEDKQTIQDKINKKAEEYFEEEYGDDEYYTNWTLEDKIDDWFTSLDKFDIMDLCKELDIDTYNDNLQLSDRHVLNDIAFGVNDGVTLDDTFYGEDVTRALENFEESCKELEGEVYVDGRMGRHIVIKPTYNNILNYETIKEQYEEDEEDFIKTQIEFFNDNNKEEIEEAVEVRPGADDINIEEDIFDTFNSSKPFENNFGKVYIIKDKYDKLFKIYKPGKLNINDFIYYADNKPQIEGFLDGAIKGNNGVFKSLTTESKKEESVGTADHLIKDFEEMLKEKQIEEVDEDIINDYFTMAFEYLETEEDMNNLNQAEDIIRAKYLKESVEEHNLSKDLFGGEAERRNLQKEKEFKRDLQYVKDIMAGKTVIDDKYHEELDLDTAKKWLKDDFIYINNLSMADPDEINEKLAKELPEIFGEVKEESVKVVEEEEKLQDIAWILDDNEVDIVTKEELGSDYYYRTLVTSVSEAEKFNYHSDYWGDADEYQQENVALMEELDSFVNKKVTVTRDGTTIVCTVLGILIDRQYNSISHTVVLVTDIEE